jgi:hypothetical protein
MEEEELRIWNIKKVPSFLTPGAGGQQEYIAQVVTASNVYSVAQVVNRIERIGSEANRQVFIGHVLQFIDECEEIILEGNSVNLGIVKMSPRYTGLLDGADGATVGDHKKTVTVTVTQRLIKALKSVGVRIVGTEKPGDTALIESVYDKASRKKDGSITVGDNIVIKGEKIKIEGEPQEDPDVIEAGLGVFFVPDTGAEVEAVRIDTNDPTSVEVRVPAGLPKNKSYGLKIVTRYSTGTLLNNPRAIVAPFKVTPLP